MPETEDDLIVKLVSLESRKGFFLCVRNKYNEYTLKWINNCVGDSEILRLVEEQLDTMA